MHEKAKKTEEHMSKTQELSVQIKKIKSLKMNIFYASMWWTEMHAHT